MKTATTETTTTTAIGITSELTEKQEQKALVRWIRKTHLADHLIKINNEGNRTEAQKWDALHMGLRVGASDLFVAYPTEKHHGLFLEIKRNRIYTSCEKSTKTWCAQEKFILLMNSVGYFASFCFGCEHGKELIRGYLQNLKRTDSDYISLL